MKYAWGAFWGMVIFTDIFILLLLLNMMTSEPMLLYWLMDTTYSVWLLLAAGAILGLSFVCSTRNRKTIEFKIPQGLAGGVCSTQEYQPSLDLSRDHQKERV